MCKYLTNYFSGNKIFLVTFLGKTQNQEHTKLDVEDATKRPPA